MVRSLLWCKHIGMPFTEGKVGSSILKCEPTVLGNDARAKATIITINEGYTIAFPVCYCEVDSVAMVVCWTAMIKDIRGLIWVEEFRTFSKIGRRKEFF